MTEKNIVNELIWVNQNYIKIDPQDHKKWHGSGLSVKIVLPCYCQAHCPFCFNNLTMCTQRHNYQEFFNNLSDSLDLIFNNIDSRPISLDITGNEPTFDVDVFARLMGVISKFKSKTQKVVLTTNWFRLKECLIYMKDVIDIVNISVHHYNYETRKQIFWTSLIPDDSELKYIIKTIKKYNITCTAVAVLYQKIENFKEFYNNFMLWSIDLWFKDIRMRSNFCTNDKFIDDIIDTKFEIDDVDVLNGLTTKIITNKKTWFQTYILKGVEDLTEYVIWAELVVDDDWMCYIDYNKRYPVDKSNIEYFNYFYVLV